MSSCVVSLLVAISSKQWESVRVLRNKEMHKLVMGVHPLEHDFRCCHSFAARWHVAPPCPTHNATYLWLSYAETDTFAQRWLPYGMLFGMFFAGGVFTFWICSSLSLFLLECTQCTISAWYLLFHSSLCSYAWKPIRGSWWRVCRLHEQPIGTTSLSRKWERITLCSFARHAVLHCVGTIHTIPLPCSEWQAHLQTAQKGDCVNELQVRQHTCKSPFDFVGETFVVTYASRWTPMTDCYISAEAPPELDNRSRCTFRASFFQSKIAIFDRANKQLHERISRFHIR